MSEIRVIHPFQFRLQRFQNWFFLSIMCAFFYSTRYNFSVVQAAVGEAFGWSHSDYGNIISIGLLTYGCAVFFNGPLADIIGGKHALQIGAAGAATLNLLLGLGHLFILKPAVMHDSQVTAPAVLIEGIKNSTMIAAFSVLWACNNYCQSFGVLSILKINANWFHVSERGRLAGLFGIMTQSGRTLAFTLLPLSLQFFPWQFAFFLPAAFLAIAWFASFWLVKNAPKEAGLEVLDVGDTQPQEANIKSSLTSILRSIFARPESWIFAMISMCIGIVRSSMNNWFARYMSVVFSQDANHLSSFTPYRVTSIAMLIGAVLGGLCAGYASDRLFRARRAPVIFLSLTGQAASLLLLRGCIQNAWGAAIALALCSFFIDSAHSLILGVVPMDIGKRHSTATVAGFFDGAHYLAGFLVGAGMGRLLDYYRQSNAPGIEFNVWPLVPLFFAILGALIITRLWNWQPARQ